MTFWLPREQAETIIRIKEGEAEAKRVHGSFYKRLKALDPRFDCFLMREDYDTPDATLRKGFYYVLRRNENGTVSCWEIANPDGSYREPDELVIQSLQANDASRTHLTTEWKRRREAAERKRAHAKEHAAEERQAALKEQADYRFRTSISPKGRGKVRHDPKAV